MEIRIRATGAVMFESEFRQYLLANDGPSYDVLTPEVMEALGVDPVLEGPQATPASQYQYSMRAGVEEIDGKWFTKYVLGPTFDDAEQEAAYKARRDAEMASAVRSERTRRLAECDWTQLSDAPVDKAAWATYRQALRDVTVQNGFPWNVEWPAQPE